MLRRKLLIIGCGRSGTSYTCRVFKKAGFDLAHEEVGEYGCCSMYGVKSKADFTSINQGQKTTIHSIPLHTVRFDQIWHIVRHPLRTIDSLQAFTVKVRRWTGEQLGVPLPGTAGKYQATLRDKLHWAMHYWYQNNLLCESRAAYRFRLEDFPWEEMLERLGETPRPLPDVSPTTNRGLRFAFKSKEQIAQIKQNLYSTSAELCREIDADLWEQVRTKGLEYGYDL